MKTDFTRAQRLHLKGIAYRCSGNIQMAIEAFQQAIAIDSEQAEFYKNLGNAYADEHKWDLSLKNFQTALQLSPNYVEAWYDKGCAMQSAGFIHDAINCYRSVLKIDPHHCDSLNNLGVIMQAVGQIDEAMVCYQRAVRADPTHYVANTNLGNLFRQRGNAKRALACYEKAIAVNPKIADAHNKKGFALRDLSRYGESVASLALAHELAPESDVYLIDYANALLSQGRPRQALSFYQKVVERNPQKKQAILNMGLCHEELGNPVSAIACYRNALSIDGNYEKAHSLLVSLLKKTCSWDALEAVSKRLDRFTEAALSRGEKPAETPFLNISRRMDSELNYRVARAWAKPIEERYGHDPIILDRVKEFCVNAPPRLTIGYLSCNFRNHPTAQLMAGLFGRHDRKRYKIICYSYGVDDASQYRENIKKNCDQFVDLRSIGDVAAAQRIQSDGVNILVDLGGFTKDSRLGIAAQRPAAIQVRYLGLAGTTGATFFDYLVTDKVVTPPDDAGNYSEKFIYMPDCYQVNNYIEDCSNSGLQRSDFKLPQQEHVYCAFHAAYKIDRAIFMTWMRILEKVEKSVLWLCIGDSFTRQQLLSHAKQSGVSPERLIFADSLPKVKHLQRLRLADTALDTVLVTGAATTSDALWAGLPVVTMKGCHFASRMSGSILRTVGLPQLVAGSIQEYVKLAVKLATDSSFSNEIRKFLRHDRQNSTLFNTERFTRSLEFGYEKIWKQYLSGKRPEMIEIQNIAEGSR